MWKQRFLNWKKVTCCLQTCSMFSRNSSRRNVSQTCSTNEPRVISRFLTSRFYPKSRQLFPFYFSNITLRTDLLTLGVTGAVFKIAGEMCRLPAYFDNPANHFFLNQNSLGWEKAYCSNTTFRLDILLAPKAIKRSWRGFSADTIYTALLDFIRVSPVNFAVKCQNEMYS